MIFLIRINGENTDLDGKLLSEYLEEQSYNMTRIAVERNGEIVPKASYSSTVMRDGDSFEIVTFVGGG